MPVSQNGNILATTTALIPVIPAIQFAQCKLCCSESQFGRIVL